MPASFVRRFHLPILIAVPYIIAIYFLCGVDIFRTWDLGGHYFAIETMGREIWPWPTGWSWRFFGGYPQGYFYPPFVHWLLAPFARILEAKIVFKIALALIVVAFPWSFWRLGRALELKGEGQALLQIFLGIVFFLPKGPFGGDLFGLAYLGLFTHAAGMLLLLNLVTEYLRFWKGEKRYLHLAILHGLLIWTHAFMNLAAYAIFLTVFLRFFLRQRPRCWELAITGVVSLMIGIGWWLPFLIFRNYQSGHGAHVHDFMPLAYFLNSGRGLGLLLLLAFVFAAWKAYRARSEAGRFFLQISTALIFVIALLGLLMPALKIPNLPFHSYRFISVVPYVLAPLIVLTLPRGRRFLVQIALLLFLLAAGVGIQESFMSPPERFTDARPALKKSEIAQAFTLANSSISFRELTDIYDPHWLANRLSRMGVPHGNGLLVESSAKAPFLAGVQAIFFKDAFLFAVLPGTYLESNLKWYLKYLGIDQLVGRPNLSAEEIAQLELTSDRNFAETHDGWGRFVARTSNVAWSLATAPRSVCRNYSTALKEWWVSGQMETAIFESCASEVATPLMEEEESLPVQQVESTVLVNFGMEEKTAYLGLSYFPNLRMKNQQDQDVRFYRSGPHNILAVGVGPLRVFYEKKYWEKFLILLSALSLLGSFFALRRVRKKDARQR